jgi:tyrosine aminotransferase
MTVAPNPDKEVVKLSIGDPTVFGNFRCPDHLHQELFKASEGLKFNGYGPAVGAAAARSAVAQSHSYPNAAPLTANDVVMASGCSQALEMCIGVLANGKHRLGAAETRSNILLPNPGFSLYQTICDAYGVEVKQYNLDPDKNWSCDLTHLESQIDDNTAGILVNNPSNPCGSVFTEEHLIDILAIAEKHKLPIIADEIYENMAFPPAVAIPLASLSEQVPILQVGGLAKQYMAPGWRIGWICMHDRFDRLAKFRVGMADYATIILGPCALVQGIVASALNDTPPEYYKNNLETLNKHANLCFERCGKIAGLTPVLPQGAMYMMVRIDIDNVDLADDVDFCKTIFAEESVHLLPGSCFGADNFFRVVICPPEPILEEAWSRIELFMGRHAAQSPSKKAKKA